MTVIHHIQRHIQMGAEVYSAITVTSLIIPVSIVLKYLQIIQLIGNGRDATGNCVHCLSYIKSGSTCF